ncbi:MAG TPA: hypothetical protein VFS20_14270 [Longimicrobium sp.]|nr:hypothetical protein [Longimicrobium sp.]
MRPRTPFGFWVAGAFSAWFGVAMVVTVLSLESGGDSGTVFFRGAAGLLAVLAAVVTEALWRVRPWVWRASLALALAYAVIASAVLMAEPSGRISDVILVLGTSAVVVVPLLIYIYGRARDIWPRPRPRPLSSPIQVPRPSPPGPPPQHTGWPP